MKVVGPAPFNAGAAWLFSGWCATEIISDRRLLHQPGGFRFARNVPADPLAWPFSRGRCPLVACLGGCTVFSGPHPRSSLVTLSAPLIYENPQDEISILYGPLGGISDPQGWAAGALEGRVSIERARLFPRVAAFSALRQSVELIPLAFLVSSLSMVSVAMRRDLGRVEYPVLTG